MTAARRKSSAGKTGIRFDRKKLRIALIGSAIFSVTALVAAGGTWVWRSGLIGEMQAKVDTAYRTATKQSGLTVRQVLAEGRKELPSDMLLAALNVKIGSSILDYDTQAAQQRVEQLGWVKKARIERRLPDTIFVSIEERTPVAIWQRGGEFVLIDRDGAVIGSEGLSKFDGLKVVVGEKAPDKAFSLLEMLKQEPELMKQVTAAVLVGDRRWNLRLSDGIDVNLPEENAIAAWHRLALLEKDHALFERDISVIDMREPDRLVVRLQKPLQRQEKALGDET